MAVVEVGQISCRVSLLQGIQLIAATDSQRVIAAVEAAARVEVAIAELRMDLYKNSLIVLLCLAEGCCLDAWLVLPED